MEHGLKKELGSKTILLITINSIVGSGIFFLPGIGARTSGPASIIAWVILGLSAVYTSMFFAELVSMFPSSGGIYEFSKMVYGRFASFMVGWTAWLVGNITTAMLIVGAIQYIMPNDSFWLLKLGLCLMWVVIFNIMAYKGIKTSAYMLITFAIITLTVIGIIIVSSIISIPALFQHSFAINISIGNLFPFFIKQGITANLIAIFVTVFLISEAFFGIESICFLGGETKDPEKTLPKALVRATIIISAITIVLVTVSLMAISHKVFGSQAAPFAYLAKKLIGAVGEKIIAVGSYLVIIGAAAGWVVTGPRLILSLAKDKLFPADYAKIHEKYKTPYKAIIFQAVASAVFIGLAFSTKKAYETLLHLLIPLVLAMMSAVILVVPILRKKMPEKARAYRVRGAFSGSIALLVFNFSLIVLWIIKTSDAVRIIKLALSLLFLGVPIFLMLVFYYSPNVVVSVNNFFAFFTWLFEFFLFPKKIKESIFNYVDIIDGKNILEYGCGVGTITLEIAKRNPSGKIYATDLSKTAIAIAKKRAKKKGYSNITFIHDEHQINQVHYSIPKVDTVISVGMLAYMQDVKKILGEINSLLPESGKICFVDYVDMFKIMPNVSWISSYEKIESTFRECGFAVRVVKKKGILWNYLIVYGIKSSEDVPII